MKDAGVDLVATCMDHNGVLTLAQEMRKQDLDASVPAQRLRPRLHGENGEFFEGSYVRTVRPVRDEAPAEGLHSTTVDREGGKTKNELSLTGGSPPTCSHRPAGRGPEFTRQKVIDALNKLTDYDAQGILPGLDWTTSTRTRPIRRTARRRPARHSKIEDEVRARLRRAGQAVHVLPDRPGAPCPTSRRSRPEPARAGRTPTRRPAVDRPHPLRDPRHPVRVRLRAGRGRPRAHVQDLRGLQPGVRARRRSSPPPSTTTCASATSGRSSPRSSSRLSSSARSSACPRPAPVPAPAHGAGDRQAGDLARPARRHARDLKLWFGAEPRRSARRPSGRDPNALYRFGDYVLDGRQMDDPRSPSVVVLVPRRAVPLDRHRAADARGGREPAADRAGRRQRRPGQHGRVDAVERLRRPRRRAARAAVRAGGVVQLHHAARRRDRGRRVRPADEHPDGVARRDPARRRPGRRCTGYLPPTASSPTACGRRCRSSALFLLLLFWPGLRQPARGRPTRSPASTRRRRRWPRPTRTRVRSRRHHVPRRRLIVGRLISVACSWSTTSGCSLFTSAVVYSVIFLSITVITGMGGQISLCQATFAGIGAFTTAQLVDRFERARRWSP